MTPERRAEIEEHRERLEAMVEDNGQTWDLSENDKAAIRWALAALPASEPDEATVDRMVREARRREILDWLEEQVGTGWTCQCGHMMYNSCAPWCHDCGTEAPLEHVIAFKLHASHTDNAEMLAQVARDWGMPEARAAIRAETQGGV